MVWHHPMISRVQFTFSWDPEQCRLHAAGEPHTPLLDTAADFRKIQSNPTKTPSKPPRCKEGLLHDWESIRSWIQPVTGLQLYSHKHQSGARMLLISKGEGKGKALRKCIFIAKAVRQSPPHLNCMCCLVLVMSGCHKAGFGSYSKVLGEKEQHYLG